MRDAVSDHDLATVAPAVTNSFTVTGVAMTAPTVADLVIVVVVVASAAAGARRGLTASAFGLAGFLLGGLLGSYVVRYVVTPSTSPVGALVLQAIGVLVGALAGLAVGRAVGSRARRGVDRTILRGPDRLFGAAVRGALSVVVLWLVATPVEAFGPATVARSVHDSVVLRAASTVLPSPTQVVADVSSALRVPADLAALVPADPETASPTTAQVATVGEAAQASVLSVHTTTANGGKEGTAFVVRRGVVATNAHVLAGATSVTVTDAHGVHRATPVVVDTAADIALLEVDGLDAAPLTLAPDLVENGTQAVYLGYPGDGPLRIGGAVVVQRLPVLGENQASLALAQEVYRIHAVVRPGNSGGPLLDLQGRVIGIVSAQSLVVDDEGFALTLSPLRSALARL